MTKIGNLTPTSASLRLISLREACARIDRSVRSYYDDPSILPPPLRLGEGRNAALKFAEHEVEEKIAQLLAQRDAGKWVEESSGDGLASDPSQPAIGRSEP